jgi:hypothetical protein
VLPDGDRGEHPHGFDLGEAVPAIGQRSLRTHTVHVRILGALRGLVSVRAKAVGVGARGIAATWQRRNSGWGRSCASALCATSGGDPDRG